MISTVAVGTDGSATAEEAVREAAEVARRFGAKLVLLSAFEDSADRRATAEDVELQWAVSSVGSGEVDPRARSSAELAAESGIEVRDARGRGRSGRGARAARGASADADLLVIGNKGMQRRVLGSVPNTVTHKAACSVLVVKTT